jgi:hypothetical protein
MHFAIDMERLRERVPQISKSVAVLVVMFPKYLLAHVCKSMETGGILISNQINCTCEPSHSCVSLTVPKPLFPLSPCHDTR